MLSGTFVFVVSGGSVLTSFTFACPEGITRAAVLELCRKHGIAHGEKDISLAEVYRADEVFCTGTMGELAGVTKIDNRVIADGKVGPMTRRLSDLYARRTATEGVPVKNGRVVGFAQCRLPIAN